MAAAWVEELRERNRKAEGSVMGPMSRSRMASQAALNASMGLCGMGQCSSCSCQGGCLRGMSGLGDISNDAAAAAQARAMFLTQQGDARAAEEAAKTDAASRRGAWEKIMDAKSAREAGYYEPKSKWTKPLLVLVLAGALFWYMKRRK